MDLKNVVAISCRTNTGEMFEVPVREFFGLQQAQNSLGVGVVPKSDGKAFVASDVIEGANGQLTFKNYKSETSFTGIPVGILAFDANGRVVTVPFQQNQTPQKTTTQEESSNTAQSTSGKLPIWIDDYGGLGDSDIVRDGDSYSVGGTMAFWKWDVYQGSVNIAQSSISDGFRLNGKLVVSYDPDSEELTIGNSVYTTTNIKYIKTDSISWNASGGGSITDVATNTAGTYTLTKPAKNGTYALLGDITDLAWLLGGNALTAAKSIGSTTNYDVELIANNTPKISLFASGGVTVHSTTNFDDAVGIDGILTLNSIANATTDTNKFLVSDSGVVKYRTGTEILSDIGGFASPSGLTTNYVTKWNGTTLANSQIFDNGTNVGIGKTPTWKLDVDGIVNASTYYNLNGVAVLGRDGNYTTILDESSGVARNAIFIGNSSDPNNYYDNNGHIFRSRDVSANYAKITSAGIAIGSVHDNVTKYIGKTYIDTFNNLTSWIGFESSTTEDMIKFNTFLDDVYAGVTMTIRGSGRVGIMTTTPTETLDVNGTIKATGLKLPTGAVTGYVLKVTDGATGATAWQAATVGERWRGTWAANSGVAPNASPTEGDYYTVTTAGTYSGVTYAVNDYSYYNGSAWVYRPNGYTLTTASAGTLGGIRIGSGLSIDGSGIVSVATLNQNTTGSAATLTTTRNIAMTGDVAWNVNFNGSGNVTAVGVLATVNSNVGTFAGIAVNGKGLVTGATALTTLSEYGITDAWTKTESDGRFVHLEGDEDIIGIKNFTGGYIAYYGQFVLTEVPISGGAFFVQTLGFESGLPITLKTNKVFHYDTTTLYSVSSDSGLLLGGTINASSVASERLHVNGNIRYSGTLKPNNVQGTSGTFLKNNGSGNVDTWSSIGHADITNLSSFTGFDSRYYTGAYADTIFAPLVHTLDSHSNVAISSNTSGEILKWSGSAWINNTPDEADLVDKTNTQTIGGTKTFINTVTIGTGGAIMTAGQIGFFAGIANTSGSGAIVRGTTYTKLQVGTNDRLVVYDGGVRISAFSTNYLTAPTERLQVDGNIRYNTLLKPNNIAGTNKQVLSTNGTQDIWSTLNFTYLSDVDITSPVGGHILTYDNTTSKWRNQSPSIALLLQIDNISGLQVALDNKQPLDADLTAIAGLTATSGFLKKTATNTWSLDTSTYLTGTGLVTNYVTKWNGGLVNSSIFDNGTSVGIGTATPTSKLHVVGTGTIMQLASAATTSGIYQTIVNPNAGTVYFGIDSSTGSTFGSGHAYATVLSASSGSPLVFQTNDINTLVILLDGFVGMGVTNPTEKLQVNGNIRYNTLLKPNNIAGTSGQFLGTNGTQDAWTTLTTSHISDLSSYTGFDGRYYTGAYADTIFQPIGDYITTTTAAATYQPLLPSGTTGQFLVKDSAGNLNFMDLKIRPIGLSLERIAVGNTDHYLGEQPHFLFKDKRHIQIGRITDTTKQFNAGMFKKSNNGFVEQIGGSLSIRATDGLYLTDFASPSRPLSMLTIDSFGKLSVSSIAGGGTVQASLTTNHVGYGINNSLSSSSNFTYLSDRYLHFTGASANVNIGASGSGSAGFLESVNGNLLLQARSTFGVVVDDGYFQVNDLAGTGTRMVVADSSGVLSTQTIPSGGGVPSLTSTQIAFGNGSNLQTSSSNFVFLNDREIKLKNGATSSLSIYRGDGNDTYHIDANDLQFATNDYYIGTNSLFVAASGSVEILGTTLDLGINAENTRVKVGLSAVGNEIRLSGTTFKLHLGDTVGGSYTPSGGDKVLLNWDASKNAFVLQKLNTVLASALSGSETLLRL